MADSQDELNMLFDIDGERKSDDASKRECEEGEDTISPKRRRTNSMNLSSRSLTKKICKIGDSKQTDVSKGVDNALEQAMHVINGQKEAMNVVVGAAVSAPRTTNKQLMKAITDLSTSLSTRISDVEEHVKERIDKLETSLEARLLNKLTTALSAKVDESMNEVKVELEEKLTKTEEGVEQIKREKDAIMADIRTLKAENNQLTESLSNQQRYLEGLEAAKRANNLIIMGLPEHPIEMNNSNYNTDEAKVKKILEEIDHPSVEFETCERLGQQNTDSTKPRALRVKLKNAHERKQILQNTKLLKDKPTPLNKVYVKKDIHPGVRKEFTRLKKVERHEKEKPENQGRKVTYDANTRSVTVDGHVVDKFRPQFL